MIDLAQYGELLSVKDVNDKIIEYEYDKFGNQTKVIYPNGKVVSYQYDKNDRMINVDDGKDNISYEYDAESNIVMESVGKIVKEYHYDENNDLIELTVLKEDVPVSEIIYNRDELGNILKETSVIDGYKKIKELTYDDKNQLIKVIENEKGSEVKIEYSYDVFGNKIEAVTTTNDIISRDRYMTNKEGQLTRVQNEKDAKFNYRYDKYGNVTEKEYANGLIESYEYDGLNNLVNITDNYGKEVDFEYDANGDRVARKETLPYSYAITQKEDDIEETLDFKTAVNKAKSAYDYSLKDKRNCTISAITDNQRVIEETFVNDINENDSLVLEINRNGEDYIDYTYGFNRIKFDKDGESTYNISNGQMDTVAEINNSDVVRYDYTVSGGLITLAQPRYGYSGENHEGSLQYLRARYYDTDTGVFLSKDTYRGETTNLNSQNKYIYVENNPENYTDPDGHFLKKAWNGVKNGAKKVKNVVSKGYRKVVNVGKKVINKVVKTTKKAASKIVSVVNKGANAIKRFGNAVKTGINNGISNLKQMAIEKVVKNVTGVSHKSSLSKAEQVKIRKQNEQKLVDGLANIENMRSQGKSEKEIYKAKMELIQKYCEKYDLDSIDVLKSKAVQNSMVQQINASINKVKTFKEVIVEGAKSGFRWVGEKTGALWNWAVSNKGSIFTGIAVIGTVAAIYFSAGAILPLIKSIYGAGLINGIIAVSATIKPALLMATTSAMFSNTVLVIKSLIGEEMTKIDKVLAVVNAVVLMGSSLVNAAIEAASIYDKFKGQSKGVEVKGTGNGPLISEELKNIGTPGENSGIRHVQGSVQDARAFFDNQVIGDTVNEVKPGVFVGKGADGFTYTYRASSVSGPPTIDINGIEGLRKLKFIK